jgi:hypothetical protein
LEAIVMSMCLSPARAAASRKNGAKSRGPATRAGKVRSAQNALKHGLCAQKYLVADEDQEAFAAFEAAILEEIAPDGVLQKILAGRVVRAAWRLERAERIETELFANRMWGGDADLALALIRDGNGTRSFDTLLRYRGAALAELFRALRMLQAMQDEARTIEAPEPPREPRNDPKARADTGEKAGSDNGYGPPERPVTHQAGRSPGHGRAAAPRGLSRPALSACTR